MNCADIAELSPLFLSGELDQPRAHAFAEHLRACPACAGELEHQTKWDALLRDSVLSEQIDTAALHQRVHAFISSRRTVSRRAR